MNLDSSPIVGISEGFLTRFDFAVHNEAVSLDNAEWTRFVPLDGACVDADLDGYGDPGSASCPRGAALDCDDTDPARSPGNLEIPFDGIDNDCDSSTPVQEGCNERQ